MQATREIKIANSKTISLTVPESFRNKRIEIIMFPCEEKKTSTAKGKNVKAFFASVDKNTFKLPARYKFNRNEINER
ncbi:MAG: hypothetical protein A2017_00340 [Lentisphaerae bacterium GWF2_44_16]|nr:MAG: hypothetical protein A2017_00340 [Lentisphaerae bacterium GWF2_44_16]